MSEKKLLIPVSKDEMVIPGHEDADLDQFEEGEWQFFENDERELHAEYIGTDPGQDELELVWYPSRNERYWGVVRSKS